METQQKAKKIQSVSSTNILLTSIHDLKKISLKVRSDQINQNILVDAKEIIGLRLVVRHTED